MHQNRFHKLYHRICRRACLAAVLASFLLFLPFLPAAGAAELPGPGSGFPAGSAGADAAGTLTLESENFAHPATIQWDWQIFFSDPASYGDKRDLLYAALWLSDAALRSGESCQEALEQLGFSNVVNRYYEDSYLATTDRPAFSIGTKELEINGRRKLLAALVVRGTHDLKDFLMKDLAGGAGIGIELDSESGALRVTAGSGQNGGFLDAGRNTAQDFQAYLSTAYSAFAPEDTILFITGHSLGGAVANQAGRLLPRYGYAREHSFVYTFASPYVALEGEDPAAFPNVFNILHDMDPVPDAPTGAARAGTDVVYGGAGYDLINGMKLNLWAHAIDAYEKCLDAGSIRRVTRNGEDVSLDTW